MPTEYGLIDGEIWKCIFSDCYAVSNFGRVMRTYNARWSICGKILGSRGESHGYARVAIHLDSKRIEIMTHTLVAREFIGENHSNLEINHKDGNKLNNHWLNLEYVTRSQNQQHARHTGLNKCKLSEETIRKIREDLENGIFQYVIAEKYNCSQQHVSRIKNKTRRKTKWESQ